AALTRVLVLDAEPVRRSDRSVCLAPEDARPPVRPATGAEPMAASEPCPTPREGWPPTLLSWLVPLLLGGGLVGFLLVRSHSVQEALVVLALVLLLFGRKLPEVGRYLGRGIIEFKRGVRGLEDDLDTPPTPAPSRPHQATVRYYSRMNPERVYPLL